MSGFADLFDRQADSIERPLQLPPGTVEAVVVGLPEMVESRQKKTPGLRFVLRPVEYKECEDEALFEERGGIKESDKLIHNFWIPRDSEDKQEMAFYRLKKLLNDTFGIDTAGKSMSQAISELPDRVVWVVVVNTPSDNNPEEVYAEVDRLVRPE